MTDTQTASIASIASEVLLLAIFLWLPVMRRERAFFGVRVDPETYQGEGRRILRRYWQTLIAVFIMLSALGYYASARWQQPVLVVLVSLSTTAAAFIIYGHYARSIRALRVETTATRFASSLKARSIDDYTRIWLELFIMLLVFGTLALLIYFYPQMPERMPVHWNVKGEPDSWMRKSFSSVFFLPVLGIYLQVFFYVLKRDLVGAKMTLPVEHTEDYLRGKERFLLMNLRTIDWVRAGVALLFAGLSLLMVFTAIDEFKRFQPFANAGIGIVVALLLGGIFYYIARMMLINSELEALTGEDYVQKPGDEKHWRHGGLTYYNPEDPALVVEKMVGLGYTLNLGNPRIRSRAALIAPLPLFVLWAMISL